MTDQDAARPSISSSNLKISHVLHRGMKVLAAMRSRSQKEEYSAALLAWFQQHRGDLPADLRRQIDEYKADHQ